MPRPARRTRAVSRTKVTAKDTVGTATTEPSTSTPASDNSIRRRTRRSDVASRTPSVGSDTKRRTSLRQAAATTTTAPAQRPRQLSPRHTSGPDASGLDIMDDTFADIDTNLGDGHDLGGLSDLDNDLDAFSLDGLDDLDGLDSPGAETTAHTDGSSFNVGLFRRGRPRQSSIHSRDDAPIRPSSRSGHAALANTTTTPSVSSSFSLGTFKRRKREPSILGRHRRSRQTRDASHTRDGESGSELGTGPYTSDAESSSMATSRISRRTTSRAQTGAASQVAASADSSTMSASNTTSMLLMARTRTRGAKRKSEDGQREDELPKRRSTGRAAAVTATATSVPPSDSSVLQSIEAAAEAGVEADVEAGVEAGMEADTAADVAEALSSPLSSPPRPASLRMSDADRRRYTTPGGPDDEIMAPPMSSDSESSSPPNWPTLKTLTHGVRRGKATVTSTAAAVPALPLSRQTPDLVDDDASDISSPPSLTHSPNYHAALPPNKGKVTRNTARARSVEVAPLTTAALAALLPQRHRRGRSNHRNVSEDEDEDDNDGDNELERSALLSEDDDELAHRPNRGGLRRGRSATRPRVLAQKSMPAAAAANNRQATTDAASQKKRRRTYGSRSFDKENTTLDAEETVDAEESTFNPTAGDTFEDDTTIVVQAAAAQKARRYFGEELDNAAKKFKEVDKWTLEFESVSRESSPIGAR